MTNRFFAIAVLVIASASLSADDSILIWSNGDTLSGTLENADDKVLTWKSTLFTDPLKIQLSTLASVSFPKSKTSAEDNQDFRILMKNGDMLYGNLTAVSDKTLSFEGARLGRFELARDHILNLQRSKSSAGVLYTGPRGLDGWQPAFRREPSQNGQARAMHRIAVAKPAADPAAAVAPPEKTSAWTEQPDGSLTTIRPDAALFLPLTLPEKFEIDIELSSKKTLSFVMAVGRDAKSGLRLESWIDVLVAANGTTFATLQQISNKAHTLHLHLFVDYTAKKMLVYAPDGRKLGEVPISGLRSAAQGITLRNGEWDLSLHQLRISHWDGTEPNVVDNNSARIQMTDGTRHLGSIQSFEARSGLVTILNDGQPVELPLENITSILLPAEAGESNHPRGAAQLLWQDAGLVSGSVTSVADGHVFIKPDYSKTPLKCSLTNALRLGLTPTTNPTTQSDRLFHSQGSLQGSLVVDGEGDAPIQWTPLGGINASTLKNGGEARFVRGARITHFSDAPELLKNFADVIYLKNNDVLPCRIESCTEDTVGLVLPFSSVRSFPWSEIRALEFSATGRVHQKSFAAPGWKGIVLKKIPRSPEERTRPDARGVPAVTTQLTPPEDAASVITLKGNASVSHPEILTGDTVRFRVRWPIQSYSNLTVSLFGDGSRKDPASTHVAFALMQATMQVLDRAPAQDQDQRFFRGFGGQNSENIIRAPQGEADVQIVAHEGKLLVSVNGKQVKTIALNSEGAGSKGLAFHANVTMMGNVVINGRVQQNSGDGIEISAFEIDNLSGASIRQFIEEETRQAALTVPRFRRENPPTHVLIATNGDLLRGHLLTLNANEVQFESRLEKLRIARERISAIVWLDPAAKDSGRKPPKIKPADAAAQLDPAEDSPTDGPAPPASVVGNLLSAIGFEKTDPPQADEKVPAPDDSADVSSVSESDPSKAEESKNGFVMGEEADSSIQAQLADGFRITMTPTRLANGHIHGHSKVLGDCSFPASTIRELFLGNSSGRTHSTAYENWIAKNTQDPDWDIPASDGGGSAGSEMIGTVADNFELSLLDGTKFRLKDHADKIIVLDFWASWCGPCVAALPDYIAATSHFDSTQVIFVAVNQQESADQIRNFLTERDLSPTVALDRDGAVGTAFKVTGIPHTVILGKGNVVEDVHVGYQQGGGEAMQIAIQQLLDGTWKRPSAEADAPADPPNAKEPESI